MEPIADEIEDTIQKLCAEISAERDQVKLSDLRSRLEVYLHEHAFILTSLSEDTYQALRKIKSTSRRRSPRFGNDSSVKIFESEGRLKK
jgi:hypothetical protein